MLPENGEWPGGTKRAQGCLSDCRLLSCTTNVLTGWGAEGTAVEGSSESGPEANGPGSYREAETLRGCGFV